MRLIDDEGRLFGVLNVIDAFVVLSLLAVVLTAAAFVQAPPSSQGTPGSGPDADQGSAVKNVTLDVGTVQPYVADAIEVGQTLDVAKRPATFTVSEVHVSPTGDAVAVRLFGRMDVASTGDVDGGGERLVIGGIRLGLGDEMVLDGPSYRVRSRLTALDAERLDASWRTVTLTWQGDDEAVVDALEVGMEERVAGRTTARLVTLERETSTERRYVDGEWIQVERPGSVEARLTLAVHALETASGPRFHGSQISVNRALALDLGDVRVSGEVTDVGPPGSGAP